MEKYITTTTVTLNPEWIKFTRTDNNFTIREFAKKLHISPTYLHDIENGRRKCPEKLTVYFI